MRKVMVVLIKGLFFNNNISNFWYLFFLFCNFFEST